MRQYKDAKHLKTGVEPAAITAILIQIYLRALRERCLSVLRT